MSIQCTVCQGTGFVNLEQIPGTIDDPDGERYEILEWIRDNKDHDVAVCHCCGDGDWWYGVPGEHYNLPDPPGRNGPYASNGGLCRCH